MSYRRFIGILLLSAVVLCGSGCASSVTPLAAVQAMMRVEKPLPAGKLYSLSAPEDRTLYPENSLIMAVFGNGKMPTELAEVEDAAFYLSITAPCELAVFLCKSVDGTEAVAKMCLRRLDLLMQAPSEGGKGVTAENTLVTVRGRWVVLCVSSDPSSALRAFRQAL